MKINVNIVEFLCKIGIHPFKKYVGLIHCGNKLKQKYQCRGCCKPFIKSLTEITE